VTQTIAGTNTLNQSHLENDTIAKYLPYLKEVQKKLYIFLAVMLASGVVGFIYYQKILSFILKFFNLTGITVVLTNPYQFIDLAINTGLATGVVVAFPLLVFFLIQFFKPALKPKEYRLVKILAPISLVLFVAGFIFGAWVMQFVVAAFKQTSLDFKVGNFWDISHFFAQVIIIGLCMGLVFEMPVIITLLLRLKVIKKAVLASRRRYIYAGLLIFAAAMPPQDLLSDAILFLVPAILFEVAMLFN